MHDTEKKKIDALLQRVREEIEHQWQLGYHFGRAERTEEYDREESDYGQGWH